MKHGVWNSLTENRTWERRARGEEERHLDVWEEHMSWHTDPEVTMCPAGSEDARRPGQLGGRSREGRRSQGQRGEEVACAEPRGHLVSVRRAEPRGALGTVRADPIQPVSPGHLCWLHGEQTAEETSGEAGDPAGGYPGSR